MNGLIRVLVVDDSAYVRKVVREMLLRSPFLEVVGTARDGVEALELVEQLRPDVVTLDLTMPRLDGIGFLREQMSRAPLPVVVLSISSEHGEHVLEALDEGAVDMVRKPTALASERVMDIADELVAKVKGAATARVRAAGRPYSIPADSRAKRSLRTDLVVIGVSTGGPQALKQLIPLLPHDFPVPIAVVLHMPAGFTDLYARSLAERAALAVSEASAGQMVSPGLVLIAPGGYHLLFSRQADGRIATRLDLSPVGTPHRPSVDVTFKSAADVYGDRALAVVLTGMGSDGAVGAAWIKAQGGRVLTEAEETCVVYGMPRAVVEAGLSDAVVPLPEMARAILEAL